MKALWACTIATALLCAAPAAARQADRKDDDAAIRKLCDDYESAYSRHDAKAAAAFYATDGDRRTGAGIVVKGRTAVERQLALDFAGRFKAATVKMDPPSDIRYVDPTLAILDGSAHVAGVVSPAGQTMPVTRFFHTFVLVKRDGQWRILALRNWAAPPQ